MASQLTTITKQHQINKLFTYPHLFVINNFKNQTSHNWKHHAHDIRWKKIKITKGMFEWVHMLHFAMVWWFPF
jgi:hypothetical protein